MLITHVHGQGIQWASGVVTETNAFGADEYGSRQALGEPNAFPYGELSPNAFRLKSERGNGSLILSFPNPQKARQVIIFENYKPGRIRRVSLIDEDGMRYIILDESYPETKDFHVKTIPVPQIDKRFNRIEILLDATQEAGWAQIDAVALVESEDPSIFRRLLENYGLANQYEKLESRQIKTNLGHFINTKFHENKPIISSDGNRLYFGRMFYPSNIGGSMDVQDVYFSDKVNGEWAEPKNLGQPINNRNPNGITSVSADGNRLYLINEYLQGGTYRDGFSYSDRTASGWSFPKNITIEKYQNRSNYLDFALSVNEDVIILAIQMPDSYGDQDLYVSFYLGDDRWSEPQNLGATINTGKAEFAPFLAPDGRTLYFSSEGHGGYGDADIYYTKRLDDSWKVWTEPKNLGPDINTASMEAYFTIPANSSIGYYVSTSKSIGGSRDIFAIELQPEFLPDPIVAFQGYIKDAQSGQALQAPVNIRSSDDQAKRSAIVSNPQDGAFKAILVQNSNYNIEIQLEGYQALSLPVGPFRFEVDSTVTREILLQPIERIVALPSEVKVTDALTGLPIMAQLVYEITYPDSVINFTQTVDAAGKGLAEVLSNAQSIDIVVSAPGYVESRLSTSVNEAADGQLILNVGLKKGIRALEGKKEIQALQAMVALPTPQSLNPSRIVEFKAPDGQYIWLISLENAETGERLSGSLTFYDSLTNERKEVNVKEDEFYQLALPSNSFWILDAVSEGFKGFAVNISSGPPIFESRTDTLAMMLEPEAQLLAKGLRVKDALTQAIIGNASLMKQIYYGSDSTNFQRLELDRMEYIPLDFFETATAIRLSIQAGGYQPLIYTIDYPEEALSEKPILELYLEPTPKPIAARPILAMPSTLGPTRDQTLTEADITPPRVVPMMAELLVTAVNANTKEPVESGSYSLTLLLDGEEWIQEGDLINGRFGAAFQMGVEALVVIRASGFLKGEKSIFIGESVDRYDETIGLTPIEKGKAVNIRNLLFTVQSDEIVPLSFPVLDSIADVMNGNPTLEILISGHTDVIGDKQLNYQLSLDRANAVKEYLLGRGVLPDRIKVEAFGGTRPLASSGREETRRLNRRVEITVVKD